MLTRGGVVTLGTASLLVLSAASLALLIGVGSASASAQSELDGLAWLEGEWQRTTRRGLSIERWARLPGGGLVGESVVIPLDGTEEVQLESLLLVRMGADVFLIARPRQNDYPAGFRLVAQTDTEAVFENPTHDFPQRITYWRTAQDSFTATIAGPGDDGETQEIAFHFVRTTRDDGGGL